nr:MAG TPA: hypothetical protein [Caudoviricetes sp.]
MCAHVTSATRIIDFPREVISYHLCRSTVFKRFLSLFLFSFAFCVRFLSGYVQFGKSPS